MRRSREGSAGLSRGRTRDLTATDAAVLCGVYPDVSFRRYGALAVRSEFVHETGLRILLGFAARMGGINDIGIEPITAHSTLHYLRVFFRVRKGAAKADASVEALGYVTQCNGCTRGDGDQAPLSGARAAAPEFASNGPLWTGKIVDEEVVAGALGFTERGRLEGRRGDTCPSPGGRPLPAVQLLPRACLLPPEDPLGPRAERAGSPDRNRVHGSETALRGERDQDRRKYAEFVEAAEGGLRDVGLGRAGTSLSSRSCSRAAS